MRTVVHKLFWAWDFDKEEKWLSGMAAKGLALVSVGFFCRYEFEDCVPGEYRICLELLENSPGSAEAVKYIEFLEATGMQHVGSLLRWAYFRQKAEDTHPGLFSDNASRIRYLTRILRLIAAACALNVYWGCYNLYLYAVWGNPISLLGLICLSAAALAAVGSIRLFQKRKLLSSEQRIFE